MCSPLLAATYYKAGSDVAGTSSFTTNVSSSVGWSTTLGATATTPFSAAEMAAAFPHLTVVTNADDTVTLAVDATVPVYAKMVKGEGDVYAWRFYGCDWGDVTATCGLSVPDSSITVYLTDTAEIASILANPGTPASYRIDTLTVSADADITALSPLAIGSGSEIDLNGHALTISGFGIDNATLNYQPSTATIKSSVAGGELHVDVPADAVVTNSAVNIAGHVKFVKKGAGTFVSCRRGLYYDGGNEIVEGKVTTAEGSGSNRDWSANYCVLGQVGKPMTVRKNGTLDIADNYEYGHYSIVLDGGLLRSGKVIDNGPITQTTNTWAGIGKLSLTTNSTFYLRSDTLFSGWDDTPINLNGHELLFQMPVDSKNVWMAKDMTNGTIRLTPANAGKRKFAIFKRNVDARTVDVIDEAGCISPLTTFSVRNYTSTAPAGNGYWNGTARMYVYGTFTPVTDYFYGCTMMDGSTIDLSGRSGTWSLTSAADCGRRTVDFADDATIYVKLDDRRGFSRNTPVIRWSTRPSNLNVLSFKRVEGNVNMIKKDDGVYIQTGTFVIAR